MIRVLAAVVVAAGVAGCGPGPSPAPPSARVTVTSTAPRASVPAATPSPAVALPDRALTPGAARSDLAEVCPHVSAALEAARPSAAVKARVYAEYGIPRSRWHLFRVDHDIPLGLDGENVIANLWPQDYAQSLNKDRVEDALHAWVCAAPGAAGQARLARAQAAIASKWTDAETVLGISA